MLIYIDETDKSNEIEKIQQQKRYITKKKKLFTLM